MPTSSRGRMKGIRPYKSYSTIILTKEQPL